MLITSIITIILIQQNLQVSCSCWTSFFLMIAQNFVMENNFSIHSTFGGHSLCFLFFFFFWSQESTMQPSYIYPFALLFSHSVMSDSLRPHILQHTRLPCSSPSPRAYSNSCPLSQWCHPNISSCHPLLLLLSIFPGIRVFSNESALHIRWPKYWSFSFSIQCSNEHSALISFRIDWFDLKLDP